MASASFATYTPTDAERLQFMAALEHRRVQVYDFLDTWLGATEFKPDDIHDGIYSYIKRRGKALRPLVLLLCCGAVGGDEEQAIPAAAAVEVFHTWTLVHDDIIDRDDTRRGSPTVHAQYAAQARTAHGLDPEEAAHYGRTVAILAGDAQQSWVYALLCDLRARGVSDALIIELIRRMAMSLTPQLLEGELLDVQFALTPAEDLNEEQVLAMLGRKTGALLGYAAWCGASIGLGGRPDVHGHADRLGRFASLCGVAFQLHDDLLGLTADEALLGKPVGSDLREGKRTLIVYRALAKAGPDERTRLLATLGNNSAGQDQIAEALDIIRRTGAEHEVRELANELIAQAKQELDALPDTPQRTLLASWAAFLLSRSH